MAEYFYTKNKKFLEYNLMYFAVILCFIIGAIIGSKFNEFFGLKTILLSAISLVICVFIMFIDREKKERDFV